MTEAEMIELINIKRQTLEAQRSANPDSPVLNVLESELRTLETDLAKASAVKKPARKKMFLDECAG